MPTSRPPFVSIVPALAIFLVALGASRLDKPAVACDLPGSPMSDLATPPPVVFDTLWTHAASSGLTGVGSIAQLFMEFSDLSGTSYYWGEALDWITEHAVADTPGVKWESLVGLPGLDGIYGHPTAAWNAQALSEGWLRTGNTAWRDLAKGAMAWLQSERIPMSSYIPGARGHVYLETPFGKIPNVHWYSNTVFNQVGIGQGAIDVYRATGDTNARRVALGIADGLLATADPGPVGYKWRTWWPANPALAGDSVYRIQRCGGGPGISELLIDVATTFPSTMGANYVAYARGSLDYMISQAVLEPAAPRQPAYKWPAAEGLGADTTASVIIGRGAAGIGRAFLMGYLAFNDPQYLQYAKGAANWMLHVSVLDATGRHWGIGHNGWCVGQLGPAQFLGNLYDATTDPDYGLAYLQAFENLRQQMIPTAFGVSMYPAAPGLDFQNPELFFGFAGLGNVYYQDRPDAWTYSPASDVNVSSLMFLANSARVEGSGLYWPLQIPLSGYPPSTRGHDVASMEPILFNDGSGNANLLARLDPARVDAARPDAGRSAMSRSDLGAPVVTVTPNPMHGRTTIGFSMLRSGAHDARILRITDVSGRAVRELSDPQSGDSSSWEWDGRDDAGRAVPQGLYFARLFIDGRAIEERAQIAVLR